MDVTVLQAKMDREAAIARELNDTPITEAARNRLIGLWILDGAKQTQPQKLFAKSRTIN